MHVRQRGNYLAGHHYLLGKGGYVFGSVGLSVCLFVCEQHYSKSYEQIGMKFYGRVLSVIVVAYPDRGEGNDPEPFFFFFFFGGWVVFHNQGSTFLQWTIWE